MNITQSSSSLNSERVKFQIVKFNISKMFFSFEERLLTLVFLYSNQTISFPLMQRRLLFTLAWNLFMSYTQELSNNNE